MIGSQTTSTIAEDSIASGGAGGGGRIFVISDKNMRSSSFDRGGTTTGKHFHKTLIFPTKGGSHFPLASENPFGN